MQDKIEFYLSNLKLWNKTHNLCSNNFFKHDVIFHLQDSINFAFFLKENVKNIQDYIFVDLGSGNGFPAIFLNIILNNKIFLIEPNFKKSCFLNHIKNSLNLNIEIINSKWQDCFLFKKSIDDEDAKENNELLYLRQKNFIIISKAFASISDLIFAQKHFFLENVSRETKQKTFGFYLKGKDYLEEIKLAKIKNDFTYEVFENKNISTLDLKKIYNDLNFQENIASSDNCSKNINKSFIVKIDKIF